jgi:hypothetical protein
MRIISSIFSFAIVATLAGCATHERDCQQLSQQMRNDHIKWDGNYFGLVVTSMAEPERRLLAAGPPCRPFVLDALDDDSRFVAAHVVLTQLQSGPQSMSASEWNHLTVNILADGRVVIPDGQKDAIKKLWVQK